jgi:hypothetical protein
MKISEIRVSILISKIKTSLSLGLFSFSFRLSFFCRFKRLFFGGFLRVLTFAMIISIWIFVLM